MSQCCGTIKLMLKTKDELIEILYPNLTRFPLSEAGRRLRGLKYRIFEVDGKQWNYQWGGNCVRYFLLLVKSSDCGWIYLPFDWRDSCFWAQPDSAQTDLILGKYSCVIHVKDSEVTSTFGYPFYGRDNILGELTLKKFQRIVAVEKLKSGVVDDSTEN